MGLVQIPSTNTGWVENWIESTPDLWVLIDEKLEMSQHCLPRKFYHIPWLHQNKCDYQVERGDFPLPLCSCENPPGVLHPTMNLLERVQKRP